MKKITLLSLALLAGISINAQIVLTQNTSDVVTGVNSVGCPSGDNDWARNFVLANYAVDSSADFIIESGAFGVQTSATTPTPVTVTVFASNAAFPTGFTGADVLGTQAVTVPANATETIVEFDFTTPVVVPAGTIAVAYTITTAPGISFFIGGTVGETTEGFLKSATCGVANYVTPSSIAFPDANFFMTLTGDQNLSVGENTLAGSMSLYPNPTNGNLNIKFSKNHGVTNVDIMTLSGQKVQTATLEGFGTSSINTNELASGIYFAKVSTASENTTVKFVKN